MHTAPDPMRLVCLLLLASAAASAQPADAVATRRPVWLSVGLSSSAPPTRAGNGTDALLTGSVQYHRPLRDGGLVFQVGASSSNAFFARTELVEGHVALGSSVSGGPVQFTVVAGPSVGRVRPADRSAGGIAPGLYASGEAVFAVVPAFGIGVHAFGHLNAVMPVIGAGLTVAFGRRLPGAVFPNPPPTPRRPGP